MQFGPEQQPLGQLVAVQLLQMPPVQDWPIGQFAHMRPPVPQAPASSPLWQVLFWQQPVQPLN
jgi:hypothetical protein